MRIFFLHFLPYDVIRKIIERKSNKSNLVFTPVFSGRVAIFEIASLESIKTKTALIPEYICNVVNIALEKAGFRIITYGVDEKFEPNCTEIINLISVNNVGLLLTASIYGSSSLINESNNRKIIDPLKNNNGIWINDLCQDIRLLKKLPKCTPDNVFFVSSFNNKSLPGIMGAGIWYREKIKERYSGMNPRQISKIYRMFLSLVLKRSQHFRGDKGFEYSYCKEFPYALTNYRPVKFQLILALTGLINLKRFTKLKERNLLQIPDALSTIFSATAAYIKTSGDRSYPKLEKTPYAIHHHPEDSVYPDIHLIHNKGFLDE